MRFKVSQEERDKVMASLFVEEGVRFSLGRTPVACSDYSFGYSFRRTGLGVLVCNHR